MDSAYHFASAEYALASLSTAVPVPAPETCELWLRAAAVHAQLAAVALEAEKALGGVTREAWMFALHARPMPADETKCACTA